VQRGKWQTIREKMVTPKTIGYAEKKPAGIQGGPLSTTESCENLSIARKQPG
jgi:hypothetical protein